MLTVPDSIYAVLEAEAKALESAPATIALRLLTAAVVSGLTPEQAFMHRALLPGAEAVLPQTYHALSAEQASGNSADGPLKELLIIGESPEPGNLLSGKSDPGGAEPVDLDKWKPPPAPELTDEEAEEAARRYEELKAERDG